MPAVTAKLNSRMPAYRAPPPAHRDQEPHQGPSWADIQRRLWREGSRTLLSWRRVALFLVPLDVDHQAVGMAAGEHLVVVARSQFQDDPHDVGLVLSRPHPAQARVMCRQGLALQVRREPRAHKVDDEAVRIA
jgi:hypothetical protein